jgi:hypothetical protein
VSGCFCFFAHLSPAVLLFSVRPLMINNILILMLYNVAVMLLAIIMTVVQARELGLRKIWRMSCRRALVASSFVSG